MTLEVDTAGLHHDGSELGRYRRCPLHTTWLRRSLRRGRRHPHRPPSRLRRATRRRQTQPTQGGEITQASAIAFEAEDQASAERFHRVNSAGRPPPSPFGSLNPTTILPLPHQPPTPTIPAMAPLPALPGENFATAQHSGPGADSLRDVIRTWTDRSRYDISYSADQTRVVADGINQHWATSNTTLPPQSAPTLIGSTPPPPNRKAFPTPPTVSLTRSPPPKAPLPPPPPTTSPTPDQTSRLPPH